jgi:phenylacetate-CoA ligase
LDRLIHDRLRDVLVSAHRDVPFFRRAMTDAGYDPTRDYRGPADLGRLPITRKQSVRAEPAAFLKQGVDPIHAFSDRTSGSTGVPLLVYQDQRARSLHIAKWLRVLFVNGYAINGRALGLVSPHRVALGMSPLQGLGLLQRRALDYVGTTPGQMADVLLAYRPQVLYGNRTHLTMLAQELERRGVRPDGLRGVVPTAEVIRPHNRRLYRERFGVEPSESYGSVEMGVMAYETPDHDGLHLCEDLTYFEFLDDDGRPVEPGQPGRVVVTDLAATMMPFIRYEHGDVAVFDIHTDETGAAWRRIRRIVGRDNDVVILADGRRLPAENIYKAVHAFEGIRQFRIIQETTDRFRVQVAADQDYIASNKAAMIASIERAVPARIQIAIETVAGIGPDPAGKTRTFISHVMSAQPEVDESE